MTLPAVIPAIAPLLPALMEATQFPRSDAAMKWTNLALGIVAAGIDVNSRLAHLNDTVKAWAQLGQDPPQEWWEEYTARSEEAHETIQAAAETRRLAASMVTPDPAPPAPPETLATTEPARDGDEPPQPQPTTEPIPDLPAPEPRTRKSRR